MNNMVHGAYLSVYRPLVCFTFELLSILLLGAFIYKFLGELCFQFSKEN